MGKPVYPGGVAECVDRILADIGKDIRLGMPIAVGKPTILANEFYRRAVEDSSISLKIISGLTLVKPGFSSDLEKRFMGPIVDRIFGDYPDPVYIRDARKGTLPANVELVDFFLTPGAFLGSLEHQRNYISSNYTHAARDAVDMGLNVVAAMLGKSEAGGRVQYSLGSNADTPLDMLMTLEDKRAGGMKVAVVGQVNAKMPFMHGGAILDPDVFDYVIDIPDNYHTLFGPPKEPVSTADYMIGLYASSLVKDNGTIQIGIGSLGDSVAYGLQLRHTDNNAYLDIMTTIGAGGRFSDAIEKAGALSPFQTGLYGCTELLTDAFMRLIECGIISRRVYDNEGIQRALGDGAISESLASDTLDVLFEREVVRPKLRDSDVRLLKHFGVFKDGVGYENGSLTLPDGSKISADISDHENRREAARRCLGTRLKNGVLIHAGFILGPQSFYEELRNMSDELRESIHMREISFTNQLYGGEAIKRLHRKNGRFFNTAMMVTLGGAAVSDGLEDGRVVSGVGGQYNFVSQAHALNDGRSIIMVRSCKEIHGKMQSNIIWNYGHTTIPRHLRDIYITEYGIADVRGKTDQDLMKELINVSDSRFQKQLLKRAKESHKIPADYHIPEKFTHNYPEKLEEELKKYKDKGMFRPFPYGTDLSDLELRLAKSLRGFKEKTASLSHIKAADLAHLPKAFSIPGAAKPYLERMGLDSPKDSHEKTQQKIVTLALSLAGYL